MEKPLDPEVELSSVIRTYNELAPKCSVKERAKGISQLAAQKKQVNILSNEMKDTMLNIKLATKGLHAVRDCKIKKDTLSSIIDYENWMTNVKSEKIQQTEMDCLNTLAAKCINTLSKKVPSENEELTLIQNAENSLKRMENKLDLAMKRFCVVNTDNKQLRDEIHMLLVDRNNFNIQWDRTIGKLIKGKEYLMDIFEIANVAFGKRDECLKKLDALKWKGLFQLNKDIAEMKYYEGELNHLSKVEEFLRVKGSKRLCEADEKEEARMLEEETKCRHEVAKYDALLDAIFEFAGTAKVASLINNFNRLEMEGFSMFLLLCQMLQESIILKKSVERVRQMTMDQHDINQAREENQKKSILSLEAELKEQKLRTQTKSDIMNVSSQRLLERIHQGIVDLYVMAKCSDAPLVNLLGKQAQYITIYNADAYLRILEIEIKSLIQIVYGVVKPPARTEKAAKHTVDPKAKIVADPHIKSLRPNRIEMLVAYQPCAYCVEDYILNLVYEEPAIPADKEYIQSLFHLEKPNTKYGIYSLTIPEKRHPLRGAKKT